MIIEGKTIWLTGLSCSGKSTLALLIKEEIQNKNRVVQILDGDVIRKSMGNIFGYTKRERLHVASIYRMICNLLNKNGVYVVVAAIAGYNEMRNLNRSEIYNYYEIYVECSLEKCIERDVKGMYAKGLNGEINHVMGLDNPFEIPRNSDLIVNTEKNTVEASIELIKKWISKEGVI